MTERWETVDDIRNARLRFEAAIPGWRTPAAFGLGEIDENGRIDFFRVNTRDHALPAVVLATVCECRGETGSHRMTRDDLAKAIDLLAPAEACDAYQHPNLWAWQARHSELSPDARLAAVFLADLNTPSEDPLVAALRTAIEA